MLNYYICGSIIFSLDRFNCILFFIPNWYWYLQVRGKEKGKKSNLRHHNIACAMGMPFYIELTLEFHICFKEISKICLPIKQLLTSDLITTSSITGIQLSFLRQLNSLLHCFVIMSDLLSSVKSSMYIKENQETETDQFHN